MRTLLVISTLALLLTFVPAASADGIVDDLVGPEPTGCRPYCTMMDEHESALDIVTGPPSSTCRPQC